ncbi:MAG: beta-glucuronidase [Ruminococcus sp.]|nr:beta-glucuronidase [Ruminococcus sp.]
MTSFIPLDGVWEFLDDQQQRFAGFPPKAEDFNDTINLPGTTAQAKKGITNEKREEGFLTEIYPYKGNAWFRRVVDVPAEHRSSICLYMERTRISEVWVNGIRIGTNNSLCTPHSYDLSAFSACNTLEICIRVDNSGYPTKGGHMTSSDTQTNWNGILGKFCLRFADHTHEISRIKAIPDAANHKVRLAFQTNSTVNFGWVSGRWENEDGIVSLLEEQEFTFSRTNDGTAYADIPLGEDAPLWDEYHPVICRMKVVVSDCEEKEVIFGLTDFRADGHRFTNHGKPVFLRGKHDGMIFPIEGAAPMDIDGWMKVMKTAKAYGINHYRFHTCCPPEAAFLAADLLGIYMEPEIPFWGNIHATDDPEYNSAEQAYLIAEGKRILEEYGNHPSFAMFSLGNELWGSKDRIAEILRFYKQDESRILFTQGCNNFQFWPSILPEDDFFVGVRLSKERLIRGSYAMCDAPLGHVQTQRPSTMHCYDDLILPPVSASDAAPDGAQEIEIQYGTGVRKVRIDQAASGLLPDKPVVTHEIGQYCTYPDFREIDKYTGVLQARNFEIFRERLEEKGMLDMAEDFFRCSGQLAVQCYKEELEAAMRSEYVAGFQILDIQDFSGQGTALVGILDAFMDSKGLISPEMWRSFCSDRVLLAQFPSYVLEAGSTFTADISLRYYGHETLEGNVLCRFSSEDAVLAEIPVPARIDGQGLFRLGSISFPVPDFASAKRITLTLTLGEIRNEYELEVFPQQPFPALASNGLCVTSDWAEAKLALAEGGRVLYLSLEVKEKIEGFYCTDFWCYPMFRSISESMGRPVPVGTMGLCIDADHPALCGFNAKAWSTPQWYDIVSHADCAVLDGTVIRPIVQMIDNFERNHRLGILFECMAGKGSLLVCTSRLSEIADRTEAAQFARGILAYTTSAEFMPEQAADLADLDRIFG